MNVSIIDKVLRRRMGGKMSSNIISTLEIDLLFTNLCSQGLFPS